ncbi:MAG: helix-turn-helix domain-containing protein, partial [Pseudomonadota bacterium]
VSELAEGAGVTIQTASSHLSKLNDGGLLRPRKQGRHKYFALASDEVAHVLEGLMGLAAGSGQLRKRTGPRDAELRQARVCYNHLAGDMGTKMFDSLIAQGYLVQCGEDLRLTQTGAAFSADFRIDVAGLRKARAPVCRECLDWSERRSHLAGSLGRALLSRFEELSWAKRDQKTRIVTFSRNGAVEFNKLFPVN